MNTNKKPQFSSKNKKLPLKKHINTNTLKLLIIIKKKLELSLKTFFFWRKWTTKHSFWEK
jgi:hypothetical protein